MFKFKNNAAALDAAAQAAAISKSQAVIEFELDGTVITANQKLPERAGLFAGGDPGQASQHVRGTGNARQRGLSRVLGGAQPG